MKLCLNTISLRITFFVLDPAKFANDDEYCTCLKNRKHGNEAENNNNNKKTLQRHFSGDLVYLTFYIDKES